MLLMPINYVLAEQITIETVINSEVINPDSKKGILRLEVKVKNKGDETAYSVFPAILSRDKDYILSNPVNLDPNKEFIWQEDLDIKSLGVNLEGTYHLPLLISYQDANGYPFSTPRIHQFNVGQNTLSRIAIKAASFVISGNQKKQASLTLLNLDETTKEITLKVLHAKEIISHLESDKLKLPANAQIEIQFDFQNFKVLPLTNSLAFFIAEYEYKNKHYSEMSPCFLSVEAKEPLKNWFTNSWLFFSGLVIIILIYITYASRKRSKDG